MKRCRTGRVCLGGLGCIVALSALADTCPNSPVVSGDQDLWTANSYFSQTWYRDQVASWFNLQKDHWDESWGWVKYNDEGAYKWELPKMMSAAYMLWAAIDDDEQDQGLWAELALATGPVGAAMARPTLSVVSRNEQTVDVFYRDANRKLHRKTLTGSPWTAGTAPSSTADEIVSDLVATSKTSFEIAGDPQAISRSGDSIDVVARGPGNTLYHFSWTEAGGWAAQDLTSLVARPVPYKGSSRYFIHTDPQVLRRAGHAFDVVATDNFRDLIYYGFDAGVWIAKDLTQEFGDDFRVLGSPSLLRREANAFDIVARNNQRHVLHFHWDATDGWRAENVTRSLNSSTLADSSLAAASPGVASLFVYFRSGYNFILLAFAPGWGWFELNLTGNDYAVEGAPIAVRRSAFRVDAFIRDINGHLIHSYFDPDDLATENITASLGGFSLDGQPVLIADASRIDVFGQGLGGALIHFHWTGSLGWRVENVFASPLIPATSPRVNGGPQAVRRGASAIEVFAGNRDSNAQTRHFYAPIGMILNPWHTRSEYSEWAAGSQHDFRYEPEESDDANASAFAGVWQTNRVEMKCPSFANSPGVRAGIMLHESTHVNYWDFPHQQNLPGSSCGSDPCSDNWFDHSLRSDAGRLGRSSRNHSMNQVQIEYLCDVSEFPTTYLPISVLTNVSFEAGNRMSNRILDPPGWSCGLPRPLQ